MPETIEVVDPAVPVGPVVPMTSEPAPALDGVQSQTVAATTEAASAAGELEGLIGKQEGNAGVIVALIAVLFGAGGWKFWSQRSREAHDLKVRELELKANQPTVSPPSCIAKHADLEARIAAAESKAAAAETAVSDIKSKAGRVAPLVAQVEEIDERVTVIETATKRASAKGKKA